MPMNWQNELKAVTFDVFGTVVDWRSSIAREVNSLAEAKGVSVDGTEFASAWRALYQPAMSRVRSGGRSLSMHSMIRPGLGDITTILVERYAASGIE